MIRKAPISLPGELPRVRIGVRDALLDGLLQNGHVPLQAVGWPRVQQLVQELTAVPPDVPRLGRHVGRENGHESGVVRVLDHESHANDPRRRHHLGRVGDQVDEVLQQRLQEPVHFVAQLLGEIGDGDTGFANHLRTQVFNRDLERHVQSAEAGRHLLVFAGAGHQQRPQRLQGLDADLPVVGGLGQGVSAFGQLFVERSAVEDVDPFDVLESPHEAVLVNGARLASGTYINQSTVIILTHSLRIA